MKQNIYITNQKKLASLLEIREHHLSNCINHSGFFYKKVPIVNELTGIDIDVIETAGKPGSKFPEKLADFFQDQMKAEQKEFERISKSIRAKVKK